MTPPTKEQARTLEAIRAKPFGWCLVSPDEAINLTKLSNEQLVTLRTRIETELVGRWKL